jgi:hypothetical protein
MAKTTSNLPFDSTTLANYLAWAQGIGNGLSAMGWTKTADSGQVNWANVVSVVKGQPTPISQYNFGAWAGGTSYPAMTATNSSVVTNSGLTYACILATQLVLTQALQNSNATLTISAVASVSAGTTTTYTVSSGVVSTMVGQQFVVTGMGHSANNGTFICTATSGTTSITLSNPAGVVATEAGSMSSSTSALSFIGTISSGGGNAFVGHSFTTSIAGSGNSGTFTLTSSSTTAFAVTATGTTNIAAGTATENTAPVSDTVHWLPYNYEVWQSNDSLSSTNPLFIRIVYANSTNASSYPYILFQIGGGQTSGTGYITGSNVMNSGVELPLQEGGAGPSAQGNVLFECNFSQYQGSFAMFLWRTNVSLSAFVAIDRAKDNFGNDLDAYEQVLIAGQGSPFGGDASEAQVIFKPGAGTPMPMFVEEWPCPVFSGTSTATNGYVAVFPIFPVLGYVANPCLSALVMCQADVASSAFINAILYGAQHTYLFGYNEQFLLASTTGSAIGIRWD